MAQIVLPYGKNGVASVLSSDEVTLHAAPGQPTITITKPGHVYEYFASGTIDEPYLKASDTFTLRVTDTSTRQITEYSLRGSLVDECKSVGLDSGQLRFYSPTESHTLRVVTPEGDYVKEWLTGSVKSPMYIKRKWNLPNVVRSDGIVKWQEGTEVKVSRKLVMPRLETIEKELPETQQRLKKTAFSDCTRDAKMQLTYSCAINTTFNLILSSPFLRRYAMMAINDYLMDHPTFDGIHDAVVHNTDSDPVKMYKTLFRTLCAETKNPTEVDTAITCMYNLIHGMDPTGRTYNSSTDASAFLNYLAFIGFQACFNVRKKDREAMEDKDLVQALVDPRMALYTYTIMTPLVESRDATMPPTPPEYQLVGSFITVEDDANDKHAIAGIVCDGKGVLFDSNVGEIDYDWTRLPLYGMLRYLNSNRRHNYSRVFLIAVYVKNKVYTDLMKRSQSSFQCGSKFGLRKWFQNPNYLHDTQQALNKVLTTYVVPNALQGGSRFIREVPVMAYDPYALTRIAHTINYKEEYDFPLPEKKKVREQAQPPKPVKRTFVESFLKPKLAVKKRNIPETHREWTEEFLP